MQQTRTLEQQSEIPGLFLDSLPTGCGSLGKPHCCCASSLFGQTIQPVALQRFSLVDPKTLYRKELRIAIPILQTRKLADCHFPKAVFLARSLEIKSSEIAVPYKNLCPQARLNSEGKEGV